MFCSFYVVPARRRETASRLDGLQALGVDAAATNHRTG